MLMSRGLRPMACALALVFAGCAMSPARLVEGWVAVETPHFAIASRLPESETVELARKLERFRAAVLLITNIQQRAPRVPTFIYVFDRRSSFREFATEPNISGYFLPAMRANYAALWASRGSEAENLLYHEFTHFLVHNAGGSAYPRWYNEGFAEFMGAVQQVDENLVVGAVPEHRMRQIDFTP